MALCPVHQQDLTITTGHCRQWYWVYVQCPACDAGAPFREPYKDRRVGTIISVLDDLPTDGRAFAGACAHGQPLDTFLAGLQAAMIRLFEQHARDDWRLYDATRKAFELGAKQGTQR